ncbi:MAG: hypothetical protein ABH967_02550 [Patescibacteria group bacterium]|nr:hypothetical protein [Patescibacteria group bacterium]
MKKISNVLGIRNVKNMHTIGARCIPKILRSNYLELYLRNKEMERLEKEIFLLDKKRNSANIQLESISKQVRKLQKEIIDEKKKHIY